MRWLDRTLRWVRNRPPRGGGPQDRSAPGTRRRRVARALGLMLVGALAGVAALGLGPPAVAPVGPGTVGLRVRPSFDGHTELKVTPIGEVSADTHPVPITVQATVESIDFTRLQSDLTANRPSARLLEQAERDAGGLVRRFLARAALTGLLAGGIAGAVAARRRWRGVALGIAGGLIGVAIVLGSTWTTFDVTAFRSPTYQGAIEQAPQVIDAVEQHVQSFSEVRTRVAVLSRQISDLYATAGSADAIPGDPRETRILHVSDIHDNPLGMEIARRLAESFRVDAVIDTGDVTSFGLPIETRIGHEIAKIPAPYLLVGGNHDSPQDRRTLASIPNVHLLDGDTARVRGVKILGVSDPTFTAKHQISLAEAARRVRAQQPEVEQLVRRVAPEILAVHEPAQADDAFGGVPLILSGHLHHRALQEHHGTIRLVVGSTGATGLGNFTVHHGKPYEAELLHMVGGCLRSLDYVKVRGIGGAFQIDRRTFDLERSVDSPLWSTRRSDRPGCRSRATASGP